MDATTAAAIATIIGALAAVIRWLLQVWHKQTKELEDIKRGIINTSIKQLNETVEKHKTVIVKNTEEIQFLQKQIVKFTVSAEDTTKKWTGLSSALRDYVTQNEESIDTLKTEIVQINTQLYILRDLVSDTINENPKAKKPSNK